MITPTPVEITSPERSKSEFADKQKTIKGMPYLIAITVYFVIGFAFCFKAKMFQQDLSLLRKVYAPIFFPALFAVLFVVAKPNAQRLIRKGSW